MKSDDKGLTLLELIIVLFIIGVIITLALPRLMKSVDFSISTEALINTSHIHQAIERCYTMRGQYEECGDFNVLTFDDPSQRTDSSFTYEIKIFSQNLDQESYMIISTLKESTKKNFCANTPQSGKIYVRYFTNRPIIRCGEGIYSDFGSCENIFRGV